MNEEIKEILEGIQVVITHDVTIEFNTKELKALLDNITNLQEENKRLKQRNDFLNNVCVGFDDKYEDYKLRNKKAIELCDEMLEKLYHYEDRKVFEDIKDILLGGDKE